MIFDINKKTNDMNILRTSIIILIHAISISLFGQHLGINTQSPEAALDINGDIMLRSSELLLTDGNNLSVDVNSVPFSNYRISGPLTNFSISGMSASGDGRLLTMFNRSGFVMTIINQDINALEIERIITGTGSDIMIQNDASVNLQYDTQVMAWIVRSNSGNSSSDYTWKLNGNASIDANLHFLGTTDNQPVIIKSFNNVVAKFQHGFPSNNYIGTNYQRTGIGMLEQGLPSHTLEVGLADLAGGSQGVLGIRGSNFMTHFNYSSTEDTYIRGGKIGSNILLNDLSGLGNVGIGTSSPYSKLEVNGNISASSTAMYNAPPFGFGGGVLNLSSNNDNGYTLTLDGNKIQCSAFSNFNQVFKPVLINPFGGNVGIGTPYLPNRKLEIYKGRMLFTGAPSNSTGGIEFTDADGTAHRGFVGMADNNYIGFYGYGSGTFGLVMNVDNGNIGIGTFNNDYKLSVLGTIRSSEVIVESGWADYVFSKDYSLPSLDELAAFISVNKHLPGIPSALEVKNNGLHLAEIQTKMMAKIEELTLYIIDQQRKINQLEVKLAEIKN